MQKKNNLEVFQIPVLTDNYIYILKDKTTQKTAVVDPALADPVNTFLKKQKLNLNFILNTHHHWDHTGGNKELKHRWKCIIAGFKQDAHRIYGLDILLQEKDIFKLGDSVCEVLFLPGHTSGHIAYWFFEEQKLFSGDTLFAMGCGRLFEGSPRQMFKSLGQIKKLPLTTKIYCTHEYTVQNGRFARQVDSENPHLKARIKKTLLQRKQGLFTTPFELAEDLKTNPFLRAKTVEEFARLRQKKDMF